MSDETGRIEYDDVPPWWDENVEICEELDLPGYDAPKFEDGVYVHTVVDDLESRYDCQIQFVDPSPSKVSRWEIRIDGHPIETVHRTREGANTIFDIPAPAFESLVENADVSSE